MSLRIPRTEVVTAVNNKIGNHLKKKTQFETVVHFFVVLWYPGPLARRTPRLVMANKSMTDLQKVLQNVAHLKCAKHCANFERFHQAIKTVGALEHVLLSPPYSAQTGCSTVPPFHNPLLIMCGSIGLYSGPFQLPGVIEGGSQPPTLSPYSYQQW